MAKLENYERLLITVIDDEEKFDEITELRVLIQVIDDLREGYRFTRYRPSYVVSFSNMNTEIKLISDFMDKKRANDCGEALVSDLVKTNLTGKGSGGAVFVDKISTMYSLSPDILNLIGDYNKLHHMEELDRYKLTEYISRLITLALYEQITLDREIGGFSDEK